VPKCARNVGDLLRRLHSWDDNWISGARGCESAVACVPAKFDKQVVELQAERLMLFDEQ